MNDHNVSPSDLSRHDRKFMVHAFPSSTQLAETIPAGAPGAGRLGSRSFASHPCNVEPRGSVQTLISCTPQIVESPPILAYGIDTLVSVLRLDVPPSFLAKLEQAKKKVQETGDDCQEIKFGETKLFTWAIQRQGVKLFPYVLRTGDVALCLSTRDSESRIWNAQLQIGSMSSNDGIDELLDLLGKWLQHYGIKLKQFQVSRCDLFLDIETPISETGIENQDCHVTRATTCSPHYEHRKLTGVQVGRSDIVLRVYDKLAEMKTKRATEKQIFFQRKWGKQPGNVTRVEFQLKRQAVKELVPGPTDWESFKRAIPGVFSYLVNWFRHTSESVDDLRENNNQHLAESSSFWKIIEQSVDLWRKNFGEIMKVSRDRLKKHINIEPLIEQAVGCMISVCAAAGHSSDELFGMLATINDALKDKFVALWNSPDFENKFNARCALATVSF